MKCAVCRNQIKGRVVIECSRCGQPTCKNCRNVHNGLWLCYECIEEENAITDAALDVTETESEEV